MCSVIYSVSHSPAWGYFGTCAVLLTIAGKKSNITEVIKNTANYMTQLGVFTMPGLGRELAVPEVIVKGF